MNDFTLLANLPSLSNLFMNKSKEFNNFIGTLNLSDVKDDEAHKNTLERIKAQLLLRPVTFSEPIIHSHGTTERNVNPYDNLMGGTISVKVANIEYKVKGSQELFEYIAEGYRHGPSDKIYLPNCNDVTGIVVEVELPTLNKEIAFSKADEAMGATFSMIKASNEKIIFWNQKMETTINNALDQKRKELIDFYS
jgi:hypothetical protein